MSAIFLAALLPLLIGMLLLFRRARIDRLCRTRIPVRRMPVENIRRRVKYRS